MILPIEAYENQVLREKCAGITSIDKNLIKLIDDMWETMESSNGCGLAASQVGKAIKLFIVDTKCVYEAIDAETRLKFFEEKDKGISETFINATIINRSEECWEEYEGCLSIPGISQKVIRPRNITIEYFTKELEKKTMTFGGYTARVIQHEYDHTEGILYIDRINLLSKKLIKSKLKSIARGEIETDYLINYEKLKIK